MRRQFQVLSAALAAAMILASGARAGASEAAGAPTFAKDVAPIMFAKCAECHRPGQTAPMSFTSYSETRPWVKSIRKVVAEGTMPPWQADPAHGKFTNDRSLTADEKAVIEKWAAAGAPEGNAAETPPLPKFTDGWRLGEPDLVLTFPKVKLPKGGPDVFHDLVVDAGLTEDRWVRAIEMKPGNRRVLHHIIAMASDGGKGGEGGGGGGWLGAWAAGMDPMEFPEKTGRLLKKGSKIVGDMHYHPLPDEASEDQTQIGLFFSKTEPEKEVVNLWIQNANFLIPAGAENHQVKSTFTFPQDSTILSLLPHMHYRGKDFTYTAKYPDGREEILLKVNDYDFNWQTVYTLAKPLDVPKGTRIDCVAHFDNSTNNPANPDPNRDVPFGNESFDEMMIGFVDYIVKEGVRPESAEHRLAALARQMLEKHPGEMYELKLAEVEEPDEFQSTYLRLPAEGNGTWLIAVNGQVITGDLGEIKRLGPAISGKLKTPLGIFPVRGVFDKATGGFKGQIFMMDKPFLLFEGAPMKVSRGL